MDFTLIGRSHQITVKRLAAGTTEDEYGNVTSTWGTVATAEVSLQPMAGDVVQLAAGREVGATWRGFGPAGLDIRADDGVVVTAIRGSGDSWVAVPANHVALFRVRSVAPQGPDWEVEFLLGDTQETFD